MKGGQGRKPALLHGQMCITADCLPRGTGQEQAALIPQRVAREQGRAQLSLRSGVVAVRGRVYSSDVALTLVLVAHVV